jgi:hypothetical protein
MVNELVSGRPKEKNKNVGDLQIENNNFSLWHVPLLCNYSPKSSYRHLYFILVLISQYIMKHCI